MLIKPHQLRSPLENGEIGALTQMHIACIRDNTRERIGHDVLEVFCRKQRCFPLYFDDHRTHCSGHLSFGVFGDKVCINSAQIQFETSKLTPLNILMFELPHF